MDIQIMTENLEKAIRLTLWIDLGWSLGEARSMAEILANPVTARLEEMSK